MKKTNSNSEGLLHQRCPNGRVLSLIPSEKHWNMESPLHRKECFLFNKPTGNILGFHSCYDRKYQFNIDAVLKKSDNLTNKENILQLSSPRDGVFVNSRSQVEQSVADVDKSDPFEGKPTAEQLYKIYDVLEKTVSC